MADARCKCGFPRFPEWANQRTTLERADDEAYSKAHRAHHDKWAGTQQPDPTPVGLPEPVDVASLAGIHLRFNRLEEAYARLAAHVGFTEELPANTGIDRVIRSTFGEG